ncbi:MAG: squalene/phytoene synthase family protein [Byssovorax sp.]
MVDFERLLARTSRTFALAIPLLPAPLRREVTVAYLLFRIADTFEDAFALPREARIQALSDFEALLDARSPARAKELAARWVAARPSEDAGYLELLGETPAVLAELDGFSPRSRAVIVHHAARTARGMAAFVAGARDDGTLALGSEAELRRYCYVVAGIVGELLTDLFLLAAPSLSAVEPQLRARDVAFGEGLQLVNILKDQRADAEEGRVFLPATVGRGRALAIAREDLGKAGEYVELLRTAGAPRGVVAFCSFPVLLARVTLDELERRGAGAKAGRALVGQLLAGMNAALDRGASALF